MGNFWKKIKLFFRIFVANLNFALFGIGLYQKLFNLANTFVLRLFKMSAN